MELLVEVLVVEVEVINNVLKVVEVKVVVFWGVNGEVEFGDLDRDGGGEVILSGKLVVLFVVSLVGLNKVVYVDGVCILFIDVRLYYRVVRSWMLLNIFMIIVGVF